MRVRTSLSLSAMVLLVAAAACSEALSGPKNSLTAEESAELARQIGGAVANASASASGASFGRVPGDMSQSSAPVTHDVHIAGEAVPCPRGGTTSLTLDIHSVVDDATQSLTADVTGSQAPDECGFFVRGHVVYVKGTLEARAHVNIEHGVPVGDQTAEGIGSFDWHTRDGREGHCEVNYKATANYASNSSTVTGTFCNTTLNVTSTLQ